MPLLRNREFGQFFEVVEDSSSLLLLPSFQFGLSKFDVDLLIDALHHLCEALVGYCGLHVGFYDLVDSLSVPHGYFDISCYLIDGFCIAGGPNLPFDDDYLFIDHLHRLFGDFRFPEID